LRHRPTSHDDIDQSRYVLPLFLKFRNTTAQKPTSPGGFAAPLTVTLISPDDRSRTARIEVEAERLRMMN
jgi:hypothetical protein